MLQHTETPFDTIESAQDFLKLLGEVVAEAKVEVDHDLELAGEVETRHRDALLIASYNLSKLTEHMRTSRRILNDLRTLRRLLFREGSARRVHPLAVAAADNGNGHAIPPTGMLAALPPITPVNRGKTNAPGRTRTPAIPA